VACPERDWPRDLPTSGTVRIDETSGLFVVDTPRTVGFYAERGRASAGLLSADVGTNSACVCLSSLDGLPIEESSRMLFMHLTDVQQKGIVFEPDDLDSEKRMVTRWGVPGEPLLLRVGRAEVTVLLSHPAKVYALSADGVRRNEVLARYADGRVSFVADTASGAIYYEIVQDKGTAWPSQLEWLRFWR